MYERFVDEVFDELAHTAAYDAELFAHRGFEKDGFERDPFEAYSDLEFGDWDAVEEETCRGFEIDSKNYIPWAQRSLNRNVGTLLPATREISLEYRQAVKQFQIERGIAPTGDVDEKTQNKLIKANESDPTYVKWVQRALNTHGYGLVVDGIMGSNQSGTKKAIRDFQQKRVPDLYVDRYVGAKTELRLIQASGQLPPPRIITPKPKPKVKPTKPRVVFIPGFMGSKLAARRKRRIHIIWNPPRNINLVDLIQLGNGFDKGGDVVPFGTIEFGNIYREFLSKLKLKTELLEFPYDWRISNTINALKLRDAISKRWGGALGGDARVTIIAHSMGGLVARYFIESLGGFRSVERLITVGTPHLGVPEAFLGIKMIGRPAFRLALKHFASVMEMLPIYAFVSARGKLLSPKETYRLIEQRLRTALRKSKLTRLMESRGLSVNRIISRFRSRLISHPKNLNTWLYKHKIRYFLIGSTGLNTEKGFRVLRNGALKKEKGTDGDDTVPLNSALLYLCRRNETNVRREQFNQIKHRLLLSDKDIQDRCITIALGSREVQRTRLAGWVRAA